MQRALAAHDWTGGNRVRVRMGVHAGEAAETPTGLVGFDVHKAARVAAVAHGGQVLLSAVAAELVRDALPPGAALRGLGAHRLKDLSRPEEIFQLEADGLASEFPPLRSLDNPALANNLPARSAPFVGRLRELDELRPLVEANRMITLTGAGGCGKTQLALQVAAELLDGSGDGVWLVELAGVTDEDQVPATIARTLGVAEQSGRSVLDTLAEALAPQRLLVVLDNCEHLIGACAKTVDVLMSRCGRVHVLATSREPLGIAAETIYRVPSLSLPHGDEPGADGSDAVALFASRAAAQGVDLGEEATGPVVASICRRLDGMPLAIELAAARLRSLSLAGLSERLDHRFRLLTGGSRNALPRQQTLRATVDWSYSLLNEPERAVLRRLSVFVDGFDLEAAEAVGSLGDIDVFDVTDLVGSLVDKSLVVFEPTDSGPRYRLLETIRQFAAEHLLDADEGEAATVADAHSRYFLSLVEEEFPRTRGHGQAQAFARLHRENGNLRRAMEHAAEEPDGTPRVLRFGAALRYYWWARDRGTGLVATLERALDRPEAEDDPELMARALVTAALLLRARSSVAARAAAERAVAVARRCHDLEPLVEALWVSCAVFAFAGDHERSRPLGEEAVTLARRLGDDHHLGAAIGMSLLVGQLGGIGDEGWEHRVAESIACASRAGDRMLTGILQNNAGNEALRAGDVQEARERFQMAEEAMAEIGSSAGPLLINFGWVHRQEGDTEAARDRFDRALRVARRQGDHTEVAYAALGYACLAGDSGAWAEAAVLHGVAQAMFEHVGEPVQAPELEYQEASLDAVRGALGPAFESHYDKGRSMPIDEALDALAARNRPSP